MGKKRNLEINRHHPIFPRRLHEVYDEGLAVREAIIAPMTVEGHKHLHDHAAAVPALGYYAINRVAQHMEPRYDDPLEGIDAYCFAVDLANKHPKAKPRERQLGELAIATIREQIEYIKADAPKRLVLT